MKLALEPDVALARLLASDHDHLEQLSLAVMAGLRVGDRDPLRRCWLQLDHALERHLALEEELLLPAFERSHPTCGARLRREHRELRAALLALGIELDLHGLCAASALRFLSLLRAHVAYEESVLHPWAQQNVDELARSSVFARLRHLWSGRVPPLPEQAGQPS